MIKHKNNKSLKEPNGKIKIVEDFLPTPENLLAKPKPVKVTITLEIHRNVS